LLAREAEGVIEESERVPRISYQNARVDHAIVGGSVCEVRLGSSLKSANQLVENIVDGWSVTAENLIGRGDRLQLRQCSV